ncbi:hypothetical protein HYPSUDRAFT_46603 [Hypholoma sublateritium FD-334 SS-4]|uniref:DUF6533 domain-containing protein n=1 Tax=Hypholoma sublateritium (strain FD-334 SS-4) TaxID=945553 RepID=A0A0D2PAC6_HYPSF|nr:hypothetical protein HYPSUDRAFT_46603 [Hypholoma sublateritium FD-334 SS-4]
MIPDLPFDMRGIVMAVLGKDALTRPPTRTSSSFCPNPACTRPRSRFLHLAGKHPSGMDHLGHEERQGAQLAVEQLDLQLIRDSHLLNLVSVAALTWVVYDLILCFAKEISVIWDRWNKPRGRHSRRIYVVVRYASVLNLAWFVSVNMSTKLSINVCNVWYYVVVLNTAVVTLLPDIMMLIRINAVYDWTPSYMLLTVILFSIQLTTSLGTGFVYISSSTIIPPGDSHIPGCRITTTSLPPVFTLGAWIPSIVAQCIYFVLMLKTFFSVLCNLDANGRPSWKSLREMRTLIPTMNIFARHGFIYFLLAIAAKIANILILFFLTGPLHGIGIPFIMALYPIMVTRLKLSLGEFLHFIKPPSPLITPSTSSRTISMVHSFAAPSPHFENGPITFAPRASLTLSRASRLDFIDSEF